MWQIPQQNSQLCKGIHFVIKGKLANYVRERTNYSTKGLKIVRTLGQDVRYPPLLTCMCYQLQDLADTPRPLSANPKVNAALYLSSTAPHLN
jgi:hypothetical protein